MTEFRCKHCGSLNLELEEKGTQTGLYCCDCGKWLKWVTKEEKRVFNNKNACTPIYVPMGATNGDMIKTMFPNVEIEGIGGIEGFQCVAVSIGLGTSYFALEWWNAPYKGARE